MALKLIANYSKRFENDIGTGSADTDTREKKTYLQVYVFRERLPGVAQLTIYLDAKSGHLIERAAKKESLSLSRWAREKLVLAAGSPSWPEGYASVLGSISDASFRAPGDGEGIGDQRADFGQ